MNLDFDKKYINDMIVAVNSAMLPYGTMNRDKLDTLFLGGGTDLSEHDQRSLADYGLNKNYKMIFSSFDLTNVQAGPLSFYAVITDGLAESVTLSGGRLWKRDRRTPASLLFPHTRVKLSINSKNKLVLREMGSLYHDHGYELARETVIARAKRPASNSPVLFSINGLRSVMDLRTMQATYANA
jgi:hypothetical protein